jgi:malate dehydrogenase (oxaloacetate-decarboxylating)
VLATDPSPEACERASRMHAIEIADFATIMAEADVVIATTGRPGLIAPEMVRPGQVIMALSNPDPEIEPDVARAAGAAFAADGRSVNNVLGYPGIFRGALLAGVEEINLEMKLAAAGAIAALSQDAELVPDALDPNVHQQVADAVREAAIRTGIAHLERSPVGL